MSLRPIAYVRTLLDPRDEDGQPVPESRTIVGLRASARHLLEVLATMADRDGVAWPSVPTLAARMHVSERTVQRARAELVAAGVIAFDEHRGRQTNRYRFPVTTPVQVFEAEAKLSTQVSPVTPVHTFGGDTHVTSDPTPVSGDSSSDREVLTSSDAVTRAAPPWIVEGISYGAWIQRERAAGRQPKTNPPLAQ